MSFLSGVWEFFTHAFLPRYSNNQRPKILQPAGLSVIVAVFLLHNALPKVISSVPGVVLGFSSSVTVEEIISLTNQERSNAGLAPLSQNPLLAQAAAGKARDMFTQDYWDHASPTGTQPWSFIKNSGYSYQHAGENLARDFSNSQNLMHAWMASSSHRENVLSSKYRDIGVAVVDGTLQGVETRLVVQMFGTLASIPLAIIESPPSITTQAQAAVGAVVPGGSETQKQTPIVEKKEASIIATPTPEVNLQFASTNMFQALAQSETDQVKISPNQISQAFGMILIMLIISTLLADWVISHRKKRVRLVGKNLAHLTFLLVIALMMLQIVHGKIL